MRSLSLKQDLGLKAASLLLSLLLWLFVQSQRSSTDFTTFVVEVRTQNVPEDLVLVEEKPQVEVTLEGPPDVIDTFKRQRRSESLTAFADVGSAEEGTQDFRVTIEPRKELTGLEFRGGTPSITLNFEEKSNQPFNVEVVAGGDAPSGFEFGSAAVEPPQVRLVGPKSRMERVGSVRALISLSAIRPGGTVTAAVEVLDKRGNAITPLFRVIPSTVDVTPALSPAQPRRMLLVSPRFTGALPPGLQLVRVTVNPRELRVQGNRASIASELLLETDPIDLSKFTETRRVTARVKLPAGIQLEKAPRNSTPQVEVTLTIEALPSTPAAPPPNP